MAAARVSLPVQDGVWRRRSLLRTRLRLVQKVERDAFSDRAEAWAPSSVRYVTFQSGYLCGIVDERRTDCLLQKCG